ncbi:MAG TPA: dihydrofolate reductase family protein [bacterium]|nr:dihydrofolate reductase family protein [bacterium]
MADLPSHLHLVYHALQPYPADVPLEDVYAGLDLPTGDGIRPFVYVNMVQTFDGQTVLAGVAWKIGTDVDHHLFRQLRVHADAVLYGAGTLRTDDVIVTTHPPLQERRVRNGQPPNPLGIVVTATCSFPAETFNKKFFRRTDLERLIITTPRAAPADIDRVRAAGVAVELVPATPDGEVDLTAVIRYLTGKRVRRVLCEGGPHFNVAVARAGLIDELFVTTVLRLGGDPTAPRLFTAPVTDRPLQLVSEYHYRAPQGVREIYFRFRYPR